MPFLSDEKNVGVDLLEAVEAANRLKNDFSILVFVVLQALVPHLNNLNNWDMASEAGRQPY